MMTETTPSAMRLQGPTLKVAVARVRDSVRINALRKLQDDRAFLEEMFLLLARNLAIGCAWLPSAIREQGIVAFLACRVLDAYEDLSETAQERHDALQQTLSYLTGAIDTPPAPPACTGVRPSDQLEHLLASRMSSVRRALDTLAPEPRDKIHALLKQVTAAMCAPRSASSEDQREYGKAVLGAIIEYSFNLLSISVPAQQDVRLLGYALQNLNNVRDLGPDLARHPDANDAPERMLRLLLELVEASALASHVLESLGFPRFSGARAALAYMVATSLGAIYRDLDVAPPFLVANPLLCARAVKVSQSLFIQLLREIDATLLQLLNVMLYRETGNTYLPGTHHLGSQYVGCRQESIELMLTDAHPDAGYAQAYKRFIRLNRLSLAMLHDLPTQRISALPRNHVVGRRIMISDYLMAASIDVLCELGADEVAAFMRTGASLIEDLAAGRGIDAQGRTAALIAQRCAHALTLDAEAAQAMIESARAQSMAAYHQPRRAPLLTRLFLLLASRTPWVRKPATYLPGEKPVFETLSALAK